MLTTRQLSISFKSNNFKKDRCIASQNDSFKIASLIFRNIKKKGVIKSEIRIVIHLFCWWIILKLSLVINLRVSHGSSLKSRSTFQTQIFYDSFLLQNHKNRLFLVGTYKKDASSIYIKHFYQCQSSSAFFGLKYLGPPNVRHLGSHS